MPRTLFQSTPAESELVCAQLLGAGFQATVIHAQSSGGTVHDAVSASRPGAINPG